MRTLNRISYKGNRAFKKINSVLLSKIVNVAGKKGAGGRVRGATVHQEQASEEIIVELINIAQSGAGEEITKDICNGLIEKIDEFRSSYRERKPRKRRTQWKDDE